MATLSQDDYLRIRGELERAIARQCPAWLAASADDLVQAAMLRVLEIGEKDEGPRSFSASYLWRVAYTTLVDEIRRYRRRREVDLTETPQEAPRGGGLPNPERAAAGTEIGRGIQACLATLVPPRRRAVTLYLLGHNVPEIHGLLGLRAKQAENLVYRGLGDLRKCLRSRDLAP